MESLTHSATTHDPAYYRLKAMGYRLIRTPSVGSSTGERWTAESKGRQFLADEIRSLLSIVAMYESTDSRASATEAS